MAVDSTGACQHAAPTVSGAPTAPHWTDNANEAGRSPPRASLHQLLVACLPAAGLARAARERPARGAIEAHRRPAGPAHDAGARPADREVVLVGVGLRDN